MTTATDPTEAESCPGCGATHGVQRITGTSPKGPSMDVRGVRPALDDHDGQPALSIVGLLPTPALRTAAFLAVLRAEVTLRQQQQRASDRP